MFTKITYFLFAIYLLLVPNRMLSLHNQKHYARIYGFILLCISFDCLRLLRWAGFLLPQYYQFFNDLLYLLVNIIVSIITGNTAIAENGVKWNTAMYKVTK